MFRRWIESLGQGLLLIVIVALIPGVAVTYLAHIRSVWTYPILLGAATSALFSIFILAVYAARRLPPKRVIPNAENIEACVRAWLNKFNIGVKNNPGPQAYFRVTATMDNGLHMLVGRSMGDTSDRVTIQADINPSNRELNLIDGLNESAKNLLMINIKLELAHHKVGYYGLVSPAKGFSIFKRIPISESLTEDDLINAVTEVEAAILAVGLVFQIATINTTTPPPTDHPESTPAPLV